MKGVILNGVILNGLLVSSLLSGCAVKVPSNAEQAKLVTSGAFPAGTPAWINASVAGPREDSGLIPQSFNMPLAMARGQLGSELEGGAVVNEGLRKLDESPKIAEGLGHEESPLQKIATICPAIEDEVRAALITTELSVRTTLYEGLTKRCSKSGDLWTWLAKDYLAGDNLDGAERALERALVYDRESVEAKNLLNTSRERRQNLTK